MADTTYLKALISAICATYEESKQSQNYFEITNGRERSMVFRIAYHLARDIEDGDVFVDIEPTRCEGGVKRKPQTKRNEKGKPIRPDLVIHKRVDTGYLAVEFKCYKRETEWSKDFKKLEYLTSKYSKPHYELGAFIYLTNNRNDLQIRIYENGTDVTNNDTYNKILKGFKYA